MSKNVLLKYICQKKQSVCNDNDSNKKNKN